LCSHNLNHKHALVLASNNTGKQREIQQLLQPFALEVIPQGTLGVAEVAETGLSFVENALIKARHASKETGLPALADDSGLEVDALQGNPGIHSARYAGDGATDAANCAKLLTAMATVPDEKRSARFWCVMVYLRHATDPTPLICEGSWNGSVLREPCGDNGFGYDPIFWVPDYQQSAAELSATVKNTLSHRGQALRQLVAALQRRLTPVAVPTPMT
jgi:XTP/dITP diphosphohydrolase